MNSKKKVIIKPKADMQTKSTLSSQEAWVTGKPDEETEVVDKKPAQMKRLVVNLTEDEHALLRMYCAEKRIFISDLILSYLRKTIPGMKKLR